MPEGTLSDTCTCTVCMIIHLGVYIIPSTPKPQKAEPVSLRAGVW